MNYIARESKKKILVTGGAGYVGAPVVGYLLEKGYYVAVFDNLLFGGESILSFIHNERFQLYKGDIRDISFLNYVFQNNSFDVVVHLAAIVGDPACTRDPSLAVEVNENGSVNILNCSLKYNVSRFIFASTCSNYGRMEDSNGFVDETSPLLPVSLYAQLKVKFERLVLNECDRSKVFCPVSLRFATVYGLAPRMRFDLTVNEFIKELTLGRELKVYGEQFWRPYCHVYDYARAIHFMIEAKKESIEYNVFNVGCTEENYQKKTIIDHIIRLIPEAKVSFISINEDPRDYRVSFEKIKREIGFTVSKRLTDGIIEIKKAIEDKIICNPDNRIYRNC